MNRLQTPLNNANVMIRIAPRLHGDQVQILLEPSGREYYLLKEVLCNQSPYFAKMFQEGRWKEGREQKAILHEEEGILSVDSFEALVQWLYVRQIGLKSKTRRAEILAVIEFVRLADMCGIDGMDLIAEHVRGIIQRINPTSTLQPPRRHRAVLNARFLSECASLLPPGHAVRRVFAQALASAYLKSQKLIFAGELEKYPSLSTDVFKEVIAAVKSLHVTDGRESCAYLTDPFSRTDCKLSQFCT